MEDAVTLLIQFSQQVSESLHLKVAYLGNKCTCFCYMKSVKSLPEPVHAIVVFKQLYQRNDLYISLCILVYVCVRIPLYKQCQHILNTYIFAMKLLCQVKCLERATKILTEDLVLFLGHFLKIQYSQDSLKDFNKR